MLSARRMKFKPKDIVAGLTIAFFLAVFFYLGRAAVVRRPWLDAGLSVLLAFFCTAHLAAYRSAQKTKKRLKEIARALQDVPHAHALIKKDQEQLDILLYSLLDEWELFERVCQTEAARAAARRLRQVLTEAQKHRPPRRIPPKLLPTYTMGGKISVRDKYRDGVYPPERPVLYERSKIEAFREQIRRKDTNYPRYGATNEWLFGAIEKYPIRGKEVAIMGSNKPWFESVCLHYGGRCTTIEYNRIVTDHPDLKILTPEEYDRNPVLFDAAFSISSFEHDGLGRYGDPLNPEGDLAAMSKMKRVLKTGALLYLAVPVGRDRLIWNAHRVYGSLRLPLLLKGWKVLERFGWDAAALDRDKNGFEPVFVLENTAGELS